MSSTAGRVIFGIAVVLASGGAAWFASSRHGDGAATAAAGPSNAALLARFEELERRLDNQTRQIERIRETADTALRRASEAAERAGAAGGGDPASGSGGDASAGSGGPATDRRPGPPKTDDELVAERMRHAQEVASRVQVSLLRHQMTLLADETEQGQRDRTTQAFADARGLGLRLEATEEQEPRIRAIVGDEMSAAVREIGPLVRTGIENAETDVLVARYEAIWAETDRKLREILDDRQWKAWAEEAEATRKRQTMLFRSFRPETPK